jgi:tetratricopeptide (TPR) repeat protein
VHNGKQSQPLHARRVSRSSPRISVFRMIFAVGISVALWQLSSAYAQDATTASTDVPKASLEHANSLLNEGKPEDALAMLHELATSAPATAGLETMLGKAFFQSKRFPQAIEHLKTALQQRPDDPEAVQLLALTYYASGNFPQALPLLEQLGPQLPKSNADGPYLLGVCYIMTQRWDDARKKFAEMFSVPPESSMAYLMFGKILIRQRMEDLAVPQIQKALELDPRLPMGHFLLGEIDLFKKNPQAAVNEFQKEMAINPTVWLVYWRLGDAYVQLENYDEAEKVLKEAIWLNEWSSGAYILLGQIALKRGDSGLAAGFLEHAVRIDPQNYWVHYFLAKAYHNLGRATDAAQQFEISKSLLNNRLSDDRNMLQAVP